MAAETPARANTAPVQRSRADTYVLITLVALAFSVVATRVFLQLTGYPQLGGETLHIAHAIWGGLLLYAAALLPLILANRWALYLSAGLNGLGAGLFIDEVGKFITRDLNYFYPPAAPLVYAFFLLSVLLYQYVRRMKREAPRTQLYHALEELSEVLDGDLDESEYERIAGWLRSARRSESENLARLASTLEAYMGDARTGVHPVKPTAWSRLIAWVEDAVGRVPRRGHRAAVLLILAALAVFAASGAGLLIWTAAQPGPFRESFETVLRAQGDLEAITNVGWRLLRIGLEAAVGAIALVAFVYLALRREQLGARLGVFALVLSLTTVNLLNFYIDQFTAVATALLQFAALLVVVSYRERGPDE
ncbi:MAG: hypothetical protein MUC34_03300 [Anaerolineae bacterium]|jgi:hypothetical protein|nr:hypothetical protein [Anaerolineae bacterium]